MINCLISLSEKRYMSKGPFVTASQKLDINVKVVVLFLVTFFLDLRRKIMILDENHNCINKMKNIMVMDGKLFCCTKDFFMNDLLRFLGPIFIHNRWLRILINYLFIELISLWIKLCTMAFSLRPTYYLGANTLDL